MQNVSHVDRKFEYVEEKVTIRSFVRSFVVVVAVVVVTIIIIKPKSMGKLK
jgi:hypothetical protein